MWCKEENGQWLSGNEIHFPDGTILKDDHTQEKDGWKWYAELPFKTEFDNFEEL